MPLIYNCKPSGRTHAQHPFHIIANVRNSMDVREARRGIFIINGRYTYRSSPHYIEYVRKFKQIKIN